MKKCLYFLMGVVLLFHLSFVCAVSEKDVLIVLDNDEDVGYVGEDSYPFYHGVLGNITYNNMNYNISVWNSSVQGYPSLNYLQSFGFVIWAGADYLDAGSSFPHNNDQSTLVNYVTQGGNILLSGSFLAQDNGINSFTDNVLHANNPNSRTSDIYDIKITNISHQITEGFAINDSFNFIPSPAGFNYAADRIDNITNASELGVQGSLSEDEGKPLLVVSENILMNSRIVYFAFPIYILNTTNRTTLFGNAIKWMDNYAPTINNLTIFPSNNSNYLDPNNQLNFTANITDFHNVSTVIFSYKCAAGAGSCTPGTDVWNNITMIFNTTTNLYENSSFTPDVPGIWQYKIWSNDTLGNQNYSNTFNLSIEYDYTWTRSPDDFGAVSCILSGVCTLGNLTINNTGDFTLDFDLSSSYADTSYNITEPFNLAAGEVKIIQVNTTAGVSALQTNIVLTINSTSANANPSALYTNASFVSYAGGAVLFNTLTDYVTGVNQSDSFNLSGSVKNIGNETAFNTTIFWMVPGTGWTNGSGNLTQIIGNLTASSTQTSDVLINVSSSVSPGVYTIFLNSTCSNNFSGCSDLESFQISVSCSNIDGVCGTGCTYLDDADCEQETITVTSGGGGGSGAKSPSSIVIEFSKIIEIVRGEEELFEIEIKNSYINSTLKNLTITLEGFLSQYITIFPERINNLEPFESQNFTIKLRIPSYQGYEEFILNATISGTKVDGTVIRNYVEKQNIKLIVQEISQNESLLILTQAEEAIVLMKDRGFNTREVEKLLKNAKEKIGQSKNKEAQDLSKRIIEIKEKAFEVDYLINLVKEALRNPRKTNLLTNTITGQAVFTDSSSETILNLAIAAFERGDYDLAEERAKSVQSLILLGRKGNFAFFLYLNWHFVAMGILLFSITGIFGYRRYQKFNITNKIKDANRENDEIEKLMIVNQKNYYAGKMGREDFNRISEQHKKRISQIQRLRLNLRNKRVKILKTQDVENDLLSEMKDIEQAIKEIQENYYKKRIISQKEYVFRFKLMNERIADIETERTTLELLKKQKNEKETSNFFKDFLKRIKNKSNKNNKDGIMLIDSKFTDILKEKTHGKDYKGKWIKINSNKNKENTQKSINTQEGTSKK